MYINICIIHLPKVLEAQSAKQKYSKEYEEERMNKNLIEIEKVEIKSKKAKSTGIHV